MSSGRKGPSATGKDVKRSKSMAGEKKSNRALSLKKWLEKHGKEPCDGCQYFIIQKVKCTYKSGYCVRYDRYKDSFKDEGIKEE